MRKTFLLLLISATFLLFYTTTRAQVFNGDLLLNTQAQVDAFNYTSVTGSLRILSSAVTNINGLSELTSVGEDFYIANTSVTDINPISNLNSVGDLFAISNNNSLLNLNGLSGLTSVGGFLSIRDNISLANIDGLANLSSLGSFALSENHALTHVNALINISSLGTLEISHNHGLTNIDGLINLTTVQNFLTLDSNVVLTNINGLAGLTSVGLDLTIASGRALTSLDGLSNLEQIGDDLEIRNNRLLTNVNALSGLTSIPGSLILRDNALLANVDGFSNIAFVSGRFEIIKNDALVNVDGLSNLEEVGGIFGILFNQVLANLDGLAKLTSVGGHLTITANSSLTNINGLSNLITISGNLGMASNTVLTNLDGFENLITVGNNLGINNNPALVDFCGLYKLFHSGTISGSITIKNNGANTVALTPPTDITVNADQGLCSAALTVAIIGTATPVGCLESFTVVHSDFPLGNVFPVGTTVITWIVTDGAGNTATSNQQVIVVDNQSPVITCPSNLTVSCASDVPAVNTGSVTATDNCSAIVTHVSDIITNQTCANRFTLTRTYRATDPAGNSSTCSQVITVYDNIPPQITGLNPSQTVLWPPNHTMRDITLNYTATDNCLSNPVITITITSNEPVNGTGDGDTDPDWEVIDKTHIRLRAERAANGNGRIYTIVVIVSDGCNPTVSASTQVAVAHNITGPQSGKPFKAGSTVYFSGEFWDNPANKHTARWLIDNNTYARGAVTEPTNSRNGKATGSYKFNTPGVYKLQMNITDQDGVTSYANTNGDLDAIVVIYDPSGGYTYGGGWFNSPTGALSSDPSATGKVSYGFTVNYFKNSTLPKGESQMEFKIGAFEFNALNFDYLSVSGAWAQFKGSGKIIGGQSGINFIMTVIDGDLDGSGVDKIRIKIYNKNTGEVYYDNLTGAGDTAIPITTVGTNSTIVIQDHPQNIFTTKSDSEILPENGNELDNWKVTAYPNPTSSFFTIGINSFNTNGRIIMKVYDQLGRLIETRNNILPGTQIRFGDQYKPGSYYIQVIQGRTHRELKLIKLPE